MAILPVASEAQLTYGSGLVGHWNFDETNGTTAHDYSGYGNNATLVNGGTWASGKIGGAISLNGVNQYLNVLDFTKPTTSFSISAWVNANSAPLWAPIAANWNGIKGDFTLGMFSSKGFVSMYVGDRLVPGGTEIIPATEYGLGTGTTAGAPLSLASWHLVSVVANASTDLIQFWRDGQPMASVSYSGTFIQPPVANLEIGGQTSNGRYWDGKIDDLALWTRALSSSEVTTLYQDGLAGFSPIPVPEPSVNILCLLGIFAAVKRRRKI
jgi:hypothetical protein